ncbi:hypothetical protein LDENG_00091270 [Lucifuga dentata]|nr:hypothetical protein LDENG_00091270 [Lucifuga dentata]
MLIFNSSPLAHVRFKFRRHSSSKALKIDQSYKACNEPVLLLFENGSKIHLFSSETP